MDAVTYSKDEIAGLVNQLFVPLKIDAVGDADLSRIFRVEITPTLIATDAKQKIYYRFEGFQPVKEFKQTLKLMKANGDLEKRNYDSAIDLLSNIVEEASNSAATPEALYLLGVTRYKKSGDFQQAVEQWRRLKLSFPNHPLIKKVDYAL